MEEQPVINSERPSRAVADAESTVSVSSPLITPIPPEERDLLLDALRGAALFGVLTVNLLDGFRVSLFESILIFHTHPGWANHAVDILTAWVFEFKAFALFSLLFGIGIGIQIDRARSHNLNRSRLFIRRFLALLAIGLGHMLLVWNGDILALYAVCGLLLIPLAGISARRLATLGIAVIVVSPYLPLFGALFPTESALRSHAAVATRVYATGGFTEIAALRVNEAGHFILPLLINSLPRTFGLMLLGIAAWRSGFLQPSPAWRSRLRALLIGAGTLGALMTTLQLWSKETGQPAPSLFEWLYPYSVVLLAVGYGAGMMLWLHSTDGSRAPRLTRWLASGGRMALTNYLSQSVIFSLLFYGFGFGLFGKLGPAAAASIGLTVFAAQLAASNSWLARFRFGPAEWLWRSLTYGRRQQMKLHGPIACRRLHREGET